MDAYAFKMIVGHDIGDATEEVYTHRDERFLQEEIFKINMRSIVNLMLLSYLYATCV